METLFKVQDEYGNSLENFEMDVNYELAYVNKDGSTQSAWIGQSTTGRGEYDPNALPPVSSDFYCMRLTTDVKCNFYNTPGKDAIIKTPFVTEQNIRVNKKKISELEKKKRLTSKKTKLINAALQKINGAILEGGV
jgi:hypothetical protein